MRIFKRLLEAGTETKITQTGRYVRGIGGLAAYQIAINGGAKTDFYTGISFESDSRFESVTVVNNTDEAGVIEIAISNGPVNDNRMVGNVDLNGVMQVVQSGGNSRSVINIDVIQGVPIKILSENINRIQAQIYFGVNGRIGVDASVTETTGWLVDKGGHWEDRNTSEFWFYPFSNGVVDIIEGFRI